MEKKNTCKYTSIILSKSIAKVFQTMCLINKMLLLDIRRFRNSKHTKPIDFLLWSGGSRRDKS